MEEDNPEELERRTFLRKAALTGLAAAWVTPILQTVSVPSALADDNQSPPPGTTGESESEDESEDNSNGESDDDSDGD